MPLKDLWCTCQSLSNAATKHPDHFQPRIKFRQCSYCEMLSRKKYGT